MTKRCAIATPGAEFQELLSKKQKITCSPTTPSPRTTLGLSSPSASPPAQQKPEMMKKLMTHGAIATGLKVAGFVNVFRKATSMDFAKALTLEAPDLKVMIDTVKNDMLAKKHAQQHEAVDDAIDQVLRGTQLLEDEPQDPSAAAGAAGQTSDPSAAADAAGQTSALVLATALSAIKAAATAAGPAAATAGPAAATAERATAAENAEQQETKQPKEGNHDHDDRKKIYADRQAWRRLVKKQRYVSN